MTGERGEVTDKKALVRAYYESLDSHAYDRLESLLAPEFVHDRPEMTLDGREAFVQFMREKRPEMETTHRVETIFETGQGRALATQGELLDTNGERIIGFVDIVSVSGGTILGIETYTD